MNPHQKAYFNLMTQYREHVFYTSEHIASSDRWNTKINMFLAITSSSSIGGWIIWSKLSWLWAGIIAISHVIGAIKTHLPFKKRLSILYSVRNHLDLLCLDIEKESFIVFNGELTEKEIHERICKYKSKKSIIEQKYLSSIVIPENSTFIARARNKNKVYFNNLYVWE